MSTYPGNNSLSTAVKDRVVSTYDHTLALFKDGRTDEVVAGCNLILQMDPQFEPARKLLDQARKPGGRTLDFSAIGVPAGPADGLREAREAMAARDFQRVVSITTDILTNDLMNDEARVLSDEARDKMEAAPFVDQFVRKCEQHIASGNLSAARTDLEKARALDSSHPGIAKVAAVMAAKESSRPASDASSFVVENPTAAGTARGSAQATDFGFTFEEEKSQPSAFASFSFESPAQPASSPAAKPEAPTAFSFDSPLPASPAAPAYTGFEAPPAAAREFDFSTASIETSPDDQRKIEQYLTDGDRAFSGGDYQGAIDLWSRIFLIDVTNEAASDRIERAKVLRREAEQKLDSVIAAGIQAFEKRDFATARARFNEVLQVDRNNNSALDYLQRIEESGTSSPFVAPSESPFDNSVLEDDAFAERESDAITPPPPSARPAAKTTSKKASAGEKRRINPIVAGVVALVVLLGGYFAYSAFFGKPDFDPSATSATISRATSLGQKGQYDQAIALLQEVKPGDPQYDTALALIADLQAKKQKAATMVEGRPAAVYYEEKLVAARSAFDAHDYVGAKTAFEAAMRVKPLPPDLKASYDTAAQQVAKLTTAKTLFAERKFADVIVALQPMLAQDPQNKNIQRMITDAHFNLGTVALQEERLPEAIKEFDQVLAADAGDELARRSRDLAQRYEGQQKDLLYRIYVKYLPLRQPPA
jgi:tetratricopeptide (TPR) repeat protein